MRGQCINIMVKSRTEPQSKSLKAELMCKLKCTISYINQIYKELGDFII